MYEEFLKQIEDFMFIEDKPEKADVIFVPGNGYPPVSYTHLDVYKRQTKKLLNLDKKIYEFML